MSSQLGDLPTDIVLCDQDGRALGFFSPVRGRPTVEELLKIPPLTPEDIAEMRKVRTGKTLDEILGPMGL